MHIVKRFGNRLRLPSTAEIKHELRLMMVQDRIDEARIELNEIAEIAGQRDKRTSGQSGGNIQRE